MGDKTVAIIQARMGSTRLPGKVLKPIDGRPMLWHVVARTRATSLVDEVVVATTTKNQDDQIVDYCTRNGVRYNRGSEIDVLNRYYETAKQFDADTIVRITSDCPLISPAIIDRLVRTFEEHSVAFVSNKDPFTHPIGLQAEVMKMETLRRVEQEADRPDDREHVTRYIRRSDGFDKLTIRNLLDTSEYRVTDHNTVLRWVVDYQSDLDFVREIYRYLSNGERCIFGQMSVFELLERRPELVAMTDHTTADALTLD